MATFLFAFHYLPLLFNWPAQQTIDVPGGAPTIQAAIELATDGDTVEVAPGTYEERIDFLGKAITVRSLLGSQVTMIDSAAASTWPEAPHFAAVRFRSGEGEESVLEGFTITGVVTPVGFDAEAGVHCADGAYPTIRSCVIRDNLRAHGVYGGAPGGIIEDCMISGNMVGDEAGGVGTSPDGGGVNGHFVIRRCTIEGNSARSGGGVMLWGLGSIEDSLVAQNTATSHQGGGISANGLGPITGTVVRGNEVLLGAPSHTPLGAGIHAWGGTHVKVVGCTVIDNTAPPGYMPGTGGVFGLVDLSGCVIRGNSSVQVAGFTSTFEYSNIDGGFAGTGNIDADPMFVDAASGDFRLLPNSPCVDAGDPEDASDADGTIADMGAIPLDQHPVCLPGQATVTSTAAFDHVGRALAANGPYVISGVRDVDGPGFESGAASIVYRDGKEWIELPQLVASDLAAGDLFGHSVALDDGVALIGARGASAEAGAVYVFRQQPDGAWAEEAKLTASDAVAGNWLGSRVAVEGDVAAASALHADAPGADSGAVYVFRDGGSGWAQEQKLTGLDTVASDQFGKGLGISGGRILVGAYGDDDAGQDSGSAYVFRDDGGAWTQEAKLTASDAAQSALFGNEVALDGDVAVVAARSDSGVGAVYVFRRSGTSWSQESKLTSSTPFASAEFGSAVDIVGDRILVGARLDDSAADDGGAAYLFEFDGSTWTETAKYTLPSAAPGDHLGSAVALSGSYAMVGAEWADDPALDSGELWAFPVPGICAPTISSVQATSAQTPDAVTATGMFLSQTQEVLVEGIPATLIDATDTTVTYKPQPGVPGYVQLQASSFTGAAFDGTASAVQQLYPSLQVSTTGVGGAVDVTLDNGDVGLYALAFATGVFPAPIPIASPPTWYGVLLDIVGPVFTPATGAFATAEPASLSLPVPNNPALAGLTLHFQAWCQQGLFGPVTASFTNAAAVTL